MSDKKIVDLTSLSDDDNKEEEEDVMNLVSPDTTKGGGTVEEDVDARASRLRDQLAARAKSMRHLVNLGKEMRRGLVPGGRQQEEEEEVGVVVEDEGGSLPSEKDTPREKKTEKSRAAEEKKLERAKLAEEKKLERAKLAEEKKQERAKLQEVKKLQRQVLSEKYVLKFIQVVMTPELMSQPLGLAIGQAFQKTAEKAEHERISYKVASIEQYGNHPMLAWNRIEPDSDNGGMLESEEPFAMICLEGKDMIEKIGNGWMDAMLNGVPQGHRVHILVHRLEQSMRQREAEDHREAMSQNSLSQAPRFIASSVENYMTSLLVERADVDVFDASSLEEASNHVLAITRAIAMRHIDVGSGAKYLQGKSKRRNGSTNLETLLVSRPLARDDMLYPIRALCALPSIGPVSAHALVEEYTSFKGIFEMLDDPRTTRIQKEKELENMVGSNGRRVGPKAAKQIVNLFSSEDPNTQLTDSQ
eukprot:jgi/Picre1/31488/NNA_006840.t1